MKDDLKIEVHHIPTNGTRLNFRKSAESFPVLKRMGEEGECRFSSPITIELKVMPERDLIRVDGFVAATAQLPCSRCLNAYELQLRRRFTLRFSKEIPEDVHRGDAGDVELTAEQIGLVFFESETIEFTDAIQEQLVLSIPFKPLCSNACKGLCSRCGADLNQSACACPTEVSGSPFEVLKNHEWLR